MPTPLVHLLLAAAIQAFLNVFVNLPGVSEFSFYAAITAVFVNLDHSSDGERSQYVHSLTTMFAIFVIGIVIIILLKDVWTRLFVCSVVIGSVSHISVDTIDRKGIFTVPWDCDQRIFLKRLAEGRSPGKSRLHLMIAMMSAMVLLISLLF